MGVPPPNTANDPDGLATVRFYTKADAVFADTDNRPLSDLAERDRDLLGFSEILGDKVGEDLTTPITPGGPPTYPGATPSLYILVNGESHNQSIGKIDVEADRVKQFIGKSNLAENLPDYSSFTSHNVIDPNDPLTEAVGKLDNEVVNIIPIGSIFMWGNVTPPANWLICDGQAIDRTTFAVLFAILGTSYGIGDGVTTFNLPDFRGRSVVGEGTGPSLSPRAIGATGGSETHQLTIPEMPVHDHPFTAQQPIGGFTDNGGGPDQRSTSQGGTTQTTGGDVPHNNMQPFGVASYIIKVS